MMKDRKKLTPQLLDRCREDCLAGYEACERAAVRSRNLPDQPGLLAFEKLAAEAARFCMATVDLLDRGLPVSRHVCEACADVCNRCAVQGYDLAQREAVIITCIRVCEQCAHTCQAVAAVLDDSEPLPASA